MPRIQQSSPEHLIVNDFVVINIPQEDVEPKQIILDPDDQPMWESVKIVAPTPNSAIIQLDVDDNFVINSTHLNMIRENKFNGYLRADPHDHIHGSNSNDDNSRLTEKLEALTIKMDSKIISLNEENMREKYNELRNGNASKNNINDDTPMCERHEANYIQYVGYQNQNSYDSYLHQSHYDPNDSEKSLTELNNDVKNDLEDFKRCVRSMRTVHDKLYDRDIGKTTGVLPKKKSKPVNQEPQSQTDFKKLMTKFLDGQRVSNMFFKNNVNDMILKIKKNENNFQTKIKNMERKIDEWSKSQNVSLEQTERTDPPPPQAHTEYVNAVFTGSGKSDDSLKIQKDPPPPIISYVSIPSLRMCTYGLCLLFWNIDTGIKLYEWAGNLVAPELVLAHHLLDRSEHSLLVLRSPMYPKSKKNVLDEEEVLCQP
ncbi:hypothetical protein Tco_1327210 [Tanacetum coccineum]